MTCSETEEKLSAYADGELPAADRSAVESHLASCGECGRTLQALRAQHRELDDAFGPLREGADALARRVIEAVHAARPLLAPAKGRVRWLPMIASAAAGFLAAWLVFRSPERVPDGWVGKGGGQGYQTAKLALPAARLALATGPVEIREESAAWETCASNDTLTVGTWVRTPPRAKCSFTWSDGSEMYLNESTEVQLVSTRAVQLARGEVYALMNRQDAPFCVDTPPGRIEANGASLNLQCGQREGKWVLGNFAVTKGNVQIYPAEGERLTLEGPDMLTFGENRFGAPPLTGKLVLATRWVHELLVLKGKDDELERRVLALLNEAAGQDPYESEIRALGEHAAPALLAALKEGKDAARRRYASRILADLAGPALVPDLVALLRDPETEIRQSCARGLQRVTGQPHRADPAVWGAWYKDNEAVWGPQVDVKKKSAASK